MRGVRCGGDLTGARIGDMVVKVNVHVLTGWQAKGFTEVVDVVDYVGDHF